MKLRIIGFFLAVLFVFSVFISVMQLKVTNDLTDMNSVIADLAIRVVATEKQIPSVARYLQVLRNLQLKAKETLTDYEITEIAKIILVKCAEYDDVGLTPSLIFGLIERESGFNPGAVSSARAFGLTQCIEDTFDRHLILLGYNKFTKEIALDPIVNIQVGIAELVRLRKYWKIEGIDNWIIPLHSYFWGTKWTHYLLTSKKRAEMPSLEYGKGVIDLANIWKEKGV